MQAIQVPSWLSLVFFGLVFQNNVAEMGSTPWHACSPGSFPKGAGGHQEGCLGENQGSKARFIPYI